MKRMSLLMAARTGRIFSMAAAEPPARKSSSPAAAWDLLPVTGASTSSQPRLPAAVANSRTQLTLRVLDSMQTAPAAAPARAPSGPSQMAREAGSSATMLRMTSAPEAASRGVEATRAPAAANGAALAGLRLKTDNGKSWARRRRAMPPPMMPRPRKAMRGLLIPVDRKIAPERRKAQVNLVSSRRAVESACPGRGRVRIKPALENGGRPLMPCLGLGKRIRIRIKHCA